MILWYSSRQRGYYDLLLPFDLAATLISLLFLHRLFSFFSLLSFSISFCHIPNQTNRKPVCARVTHTLSHPHTTQTNKHTHFIPKNAAFRDVTYMKLRPFYKCMYIKRQYAQSLTISIRIMSPLDFFETYLYSIYLYLVDSFVISLCIPPSPFT